MPEVTAAERVRRREVALNWVNDNWKTHHQCPICQANKWTISDVYEWREFAGGDLFVGPPATLFPVFGLICQVCGFAHIFNAVIAGILAPINTVSTESDG